MVAFVYLGSVKSQQLAALKRLTKSPEWVKIKDLRENEWSCFEAKYWAGAESVPE